MALILPAAGAVIDERAHMLPNRWAILALGMISVIVGMVAISSAFVATLATMFIFGILLMAAGFAEVIHAFMVRRLSGFALHLLAAALYLVAGLFLIQEPMDAARLLTLFLAVSFFVGGVFRIIFSLVHRFPAWPWVLLSGVVDVLLAVLIKQGWPESSLRIIGLFVGIDLLLHGWAWVFLGLSLGSYKPAQPA